MIYASESTGREILIPSNAGKIDMDVKRQWRLYGADASQVQITEKDTV